MAHLSHVEADLQDADGNLYTAGTQVRWIAEATGALVQVYSDYAGATALGNPFTIDPGTSKVSFYTRGGRYRLDVLIDGTWINVRRNFAIGTARELDAETLLAGGTRIYNNLFRPDVVVPLLADRAAYNAELQGFSVLVIATASVYYKLSDTSADWSAPIAAPAAEFATRADAQAADVPAAYSFLRIAGRAAAGDGGALLYKRGASATGAIQSADGAYWEIAEIDLYAPQFDSVAAAVTYLTDTHSGGLIHIPAGSDPVLPASFPGVVLEYDGPLIPVQFGQGKDGTQRANKVFRDQHDGSHTGYSLASVAIEGQFVGSGLNGPASCDTVFQPSGWKRDWLAADRSTIPDGEIDGIDIFMRSGGRDVSSNSEGSDLSAYGWNIVLKGNSGFVCGLEGVTYTMDDSFVLDKAIDIQCAAINNRLTHLDSHGLIINAVTGTLSKALLIQQGPGNWTSAIVIGGAGDAVHNMDGSVVLGFATGGNKGAGTINAKALYDDGSLLTCPAASPEFIESLTVDFAKWDAFVPDDVVPEHKERIAAPESTRTAADFEVHFDNDGNGIAATPLPLVEEITVHEQRTPREHFAARRLKALVDAGYDPRKAEDHVRYTDEHEAIMGMPTQEEWQHAKFSIGDLQGCIWLATELHSLATRDLLKRVQALEAKA